MARAAGEIGGLKATTFAERLRLACDRHPDVPDLHYGRLTYLATHVSDILNMNAKRAKEVEGSKEAKITVQAVKFWLDGEKMPRERTLSALAEVLDVDELWLRYGSDAEIARREGDMRTVSEQGAVNVLAGLITIGGGSAAFPSVEQSKGGHVDLHAIISGASYNFAVSAARPQGDGWVFKVPIGDPSLFAVGAIATEEPSVVFIDLNAVLARNPEGSRRRKTVAEVHVSRADAEAFKIKAFNRRL